MNPNRDFKGVWIPKEIWLNPDLTVMEKLFLVEIDSLDQGDKGCYASNAHFADFFGVTKQRSSQIINSLEGKGLLKKSYKTDGKQIKSRALKVSNKFDRGIKNTLGGYQENAKGNNTLRSNTGGAPKSAPASRFDASVADLPETVNPDSWREWADYRKSKRKTISEAAFKKQTKLLSGLSFEEQAATINRSITNDWTGLFPTVDQPQTKTKENVFWI